MTIHRDTAFTHEYLPPYKGVVRTRTLRRVMDIVKLKKFRPSMMDRHHLILRAVTQSQRLQFVLYFKEIDSNLAIES